MGVGFFKNGGAGTAEIAAAIAAHAANTGNGNHLPPGGVTPTEIANDAVTDVKIGDRTVSATTAPTNLGPGKLLDWLTWFVARFKAILGTTNWYDTPPTTLTAAKAHADSTNNPHNTTAAQVGAISTSTSITINTSDGISGGGSLALNGGSLSLSMPATIPSDRTFSGNVTINGNFNVLGTTTTFDAVNTSFADLIVQIGRNNTGVAPYLGVQLERGSFVDAWALWNEASDRWGFYTGADTTSLSACPVEASAFYGTNFYAPNFDIEAAGTLAIGNSNATTINIGSAATSIDLATGSTTTTITLGSAGDTLNVPAGTITGITPAKISAIATGNVTTADVIDDAITNAKISTLTVVATTAPTNLGPGKLLDWLTWFVSRFKAILGTTNWYDTPPITLTATNNHVVNTSNPHAVTASQIGAATTAYVDNAVTGTSPLSHLYAFNNFI